MRTKVLILGQGLCGTWLSYFLEQAGTSYIVLDKVPGITSSRVASGVINPVTGRRLQKTWMAEQLLPFAETHYKAMGALLNEELISATTIRNFFPTFQMQEAYRKVSEEDPHYVNPWSDGAEWSTCFEFMFGAGEIAPAYWIRLRTMLDAWRKKLVAANKLVEEVFEWSEVSVDQNTIHYKDIEAEYIVCCDGVAALENPYFSRLPFAPNKGEALLLSIPGLPGGNIYKKGITLVPWDEPGVFWAGSTYELRFSEQGPTEQFRTNTLLQLKNFLRLPFEVIDHWAAVRPATVERRPFVGFHPVFPRVGILNGMGTKGCSLAPWFAKELTAYITDNTPITPQAAVDRFRGLLTKQFS